MTLSPLMVTRLEWLSAHTFEVYFQRPPDFAFIPGQKVRIDYQDIQREYTLTNAPDDDHLAICVRHVPQGRFSPVLARAEIGDSFQASPAFGYFTYMPSKSPAVLVATGTGVTPFVAFVRNGVHGFHLLHGVRGTEQLYYRDTLSKAAANYTPCLSNGQSSETSLLHAFNGRVTDYMKQTMPKGVYDFYLCGRGEMVADATNIIDRRFEGSKVFTETFY